MPEFIAVQCFKCSQYQVSQKRKDSKFNCKLCNAKQSVRKIIAHSDRAADVRKYVQKLNLARGHAEEQYDEVAADKTTEEQHNENNGCDSFTKSSNVSIERVPLGQSRWQPYSSKLSKRIRTKDPYEAGDFDAVDDIVTALPDMQGKGRGKRRKRASGQRRGPENINRRLRVGAAPVRKVSDTSSPPRAEKQSWYQWGAAPLRNSPSATNASSSGDRSVSGRRNYEWGSAMPRMDRSRSYSNAQSYYRPNTKIVQSPHVPQTHPNINPRSSPSITPALESDGLLTTLGVDEEVQDEVQY